MYLKKTVFLIAGISRSGIAAAEFLLGKGAKCYVYDELDGDNIELSEQMLESKGAVRVNAETLSGALDACDVLVLSPGIPIDHSLPVAAKERGKRVIGEMELGGLFTCAPILAVTGTNGKTTVCSMIEHILLTADLKHLLVGNIGVPFCSRLDEMDTDTLVVAEVSSFQLETMNNFRPHIAAITNISEDHLQRHYSMANYIYLKAKILSQLKESEYAVLNFDDTAVSGFGAGSRANVYYFSAKQPVRGAYLENGELMFDGKRLCAADELKAGGAHNVYNALCAACVCALAGVDVEVIGEALKTFKGVRHRIEHIANIGGVDYYNDSKATNIDSTLKAIDSMDRETLLLLGGRDKGQSYAELIRKCADSNVIGIILFGESRFVILEECLKQGYKKVGMAETLDGAVALAASESVSGRAVLLSPACSSFDSYSGFEERGEHFVDLVNKLC